MMKASPPNDVACGRTAASTEDVAIIASTTLPPRSSMRSPAMEA
jgi:hypothetical protein